MSDPCSALLELCSACDMNAATGTGCGDCDNCCGGGDTHTPVVTAKRCHTPNCTNVGQVVHTQYCTGCGKPPSASATRPYTHHIRGTHAHRPIYPATPVAGHMNRSGGTDASNTNRSWENASRPANQWVTGCGPLDQIVNQMCCDNDLFKCWGQFCFFDIFDNNRPHYDMTDRHYTADPRWSVRMHDAVKAKHLLRDNDRQYWYAQHHAAMGVGDGWCAGGDKSKATAAMHYAAERAILQQEAETARTQLHGRDQSAWVAYWRDSAPEPTAPTRDSLAEMKKIIGSDRKILVFDGKTILLSPSTPETVQLV